MNAPRTIPRAILVAALETLGVDIPLTDSFEIHITGNSVIFTTWPNFELVGWRIVDECPSCHTDGHPHTEYCRASEQQRTELATGGHIPIPRGSLVASEAFVVPLEDPNDCTCPPAQIVGSGGDIIDQGDDPDCPVHGAADNGPTT